MTRRLRVARLAGALTLAWLVMGCELVVGNEDRHAALDAAADAGPETDGALAVPDAGSTPDAPPACTAPASCLSEATACAARCTDDFGNCQDNCKGGGCSKDCASKLVICKAGCATKCDGCSGCANANAACASAAK